MQVSLLKKLTLIVVIASTYPITGCSDANSTNTTPSQNHAHPAEAMPSTGAATTSVTKPQADEEEKRIAEAPTALY